MRNKKTYGVEISRFFGDFIFVTFVSSSRRSYLVRTGSPSHHRLLSFISRRPDDFQKYVQQSLISF